METQSLGVIDYVEKINKVESMLNEIKFFLLNKDFNESIKRGERDIKEGRVTVCQTEEELDNFFASV